MAKDAKDKKKLQKEELEKELELVEAGESFRRRESKSTSSAAKPKKLQISEDDLIKRAEEERIRKLRLEREKREAEDRERMESEREKLKNEETEIMEENKNSEKQAPVIKKLNLSMTDLERQRDEQFKKRAEEERRRRDEADKKLFEAERARLAAEEDDEDDDATKNHEKSPIKVGKIQLDYDKLIFESNKAKELELEGEMKDRMEKFRNLRQQSKTFQEEDNRQPGIQIRIANSLYCEKLRKRSEFASLRFAENFRVFASLSLRNNYD